MRAARGLLPLALVAGCDGARTAPLFESDRVGLTLDAATPLVDLGVADRLEPPPPPRSCRVEVRFERVFDASVRAPLVDGRAVYAHRLDAESRVQIVELLTGTVLGGQDDLVMDAAEGATLLLRGGGREQAALLHRFGEDESFLTDSPVRWDFFGQGLQRVQRARAIWADAATSSVRLWRSGTTVDLARGSFRWVGLAGDFVAWIEADTARLGYADASGRVRRLGDPAATVAAMGEGRVWFSDLAAPLLHHRFDGAVDVTGLSDCVELAAYEDLALARCGRAPERLYRLRAGDTGVRVELLRESLYFGGLTLGEAGAAWVEYGEGDDPCNGSALGSLLWWPPDEPLPIVVAPAGSGCLCCNAIHAPLTVALGDALVAWNYAGKRGEPVVGIAERVCDP
jgi:hypothetical protein